MTTFFPSLLIGSLLALSPQMGRAQALVGYVTELQGESGAAKLHRGNQQPRALRLGENILSDDTVMTSPRAKVTIDTRSGPINPCVPPPADNICRIHFPPAPSGIPGSEIAGRISVMLSWFSKPPSQNLLTRSNTPLRIPIGRAAPQRLLPGTRSLTISWTGGAPPFQVSIEIQGRRVAAANTAVQTIRMPPIEFKEGDTSIVIADHDGHTAALPVQIVRTAPTIPAFGDQAVNAQHAAFLAISWLATLDKGAWSLEALQQLDRLSNSQIAKTFADALIMGGRP